MTSKEALECLQPLRWDDKKEIKAYEALEQLVYRDTPMKPLLVKVNNENYYVCLCCNATINYNKEFNVFCRKCGQRLDWSDIR